MFVAVSLSGVAWIVAGSFDGLSPARSATSA
jgi:hypothetical protein